MATGVTILLAAFLLGFVLLARYAFAKAREQRELDAVVSEDEHDSIDSIFSESHDWPRRA